MSRTERRDSAGVGSFQILDPDYGWFVVLRVAYDR
jgi:hypothetical protein